MGWGLGHSQQTSLNYFNEIKQGTYRKLMQKPTTPIKPTIKALQIISLGPRLCFRKQSHTRLKS